MWEPIHNKYITYIYTFFLFLPKFVFKQVIMGEGGEGKKYVIINSRMHNITNSLTNFIVIEKKSYKGRNEPIKKDITYMYNGYWKHGTTILWDQT